MGPIGTPQRVVIEDIEMPFWSMVIFMVKWTIAAIPAFLILLVAGFVAFTFLQGALLGARSAGTNEPSASRTEVERTARVFGQCATVAGERGLIPVGPKPIQRDSATELQQGSAVIIGYVPVRQSNGATINSLFKCEIERVGDKLRIVSVRR